VENLNVFLIILFAIPVMCLAIAGVIICRYLHFSRTVQLQSKETSTDVSPELQPSTIQNTKPFSIDVSPARVANAVIPITDLGEIFVKVQEATIPFEKKGELPCNRVDEPDIEIEAIESPSHTSESTPDLSLITSKPPAITKKMPIGHGGGRPRVGLQGEESERQKSSQRKPHALKPEVVCWYEERKWFVGLETPEEFQEYIGLKVTQDGTPLTQDDKYRWALIKVDGKISVSWDEVEQPIEIDLNNKLYLLFRLAGQRIYRGRLVHYATVGWFLVIAPDYWRRDEEISESPSISPESVFLTGCQAHYFSLDRENDQKIAFRTPDGESVIIATRAPRFGFIGTRLPDASENTGPLFGEEPPRIRALDPNGWSNVGTIVVGQEGPGRGRWRKEFGPEQDRIEQEFPRELSERCSGWYFVRFYDADDRLIESQDFRFASALKDIRISPHSALPGDSGHPLARVEFLHDKGCVLKLADSSTENLPVEYEYTQTSATIPADPIWDETRWLIQPGDETQVEAEILVERVWWAIGEEGAEGMLNKWTDRPLNISRDLVAATSKHVLYFRLPRPRWAKEIRIGFEQSRARAYPVEVVKRKVTIPLGDLGDMKEFKDRWQEHFLKLWIKDVTHQDMSAVVAIVPAAQPAIIGTITAPIDIYQLPFTRRSRAGVRRMRNYLGRLRRKTQDSALRQIISEAREKWSASVTSADISSYRIETACTIALAWETLRANGVKPPGRRKRWLRKLVRLVVIHPDTMQGVRENYGTLKHNPATASSRLKR
jgi:hypothetical protein